VDSRIVRTSKGYVGLGFAVLPRFGVQVTVSAYREDGWGGDKRRSWHEHGSEDELLADVIIEVAELPGEEAEQIAAEAMRVWPASEWAIEEERKYRRLVLTLMAVALLGVLAIVGWVIALILLLA
jgi:hypothetical protein